VTGQPHAYLATPISGAAAPRSPVSVKTAVPKSVRPALLRLVRRHRRPWMRTRRGTRRLN
jgi:hypothetical protein